MRAVDIIEAKKRGQKLTSAELSFMISGFCNKQIPDYQMSAFLMAIWYKGLTNDETSELTRLMIASGEVFDLSSIEGVVVDKHSTGGVGDKVSLVLGPILASLNVPFAKMSGRGLGHTGGTLDKLESIPNFDIFLDKEKFIKQVKEINIAIIGQSENIVPADKMLYALRDVTATVDSLPLIASSIMAKKIAVGADAILLDVKCGDGAFMKDIDHARELAKLMISIGSQLKRNVKVEITNMSEPLGRAIGNKNEVIEAVSALKGNMSDDFKEVIYSSGATLLQQANAAKNDKEAEEMIRQSIESGKALTKFKEFVIAQKGDADAIFSPDFLKPKYKEQIIAKTDGYMFVKSAIGFGVAAMKIGAGRENKNSIIDYDAGIYLTKKTGEIVKKGDVLFEVYSSKEIPKSIIEELKDFYEISDENKKTKTILEKL